MSMIITFILTVVSMYGWLAIKHEMDKDSVKEETREDEQ